MRLSIVWTPNLNWVLYLSLALPGTRGISWMALVSSTGTRSAGHRERDNVQIHASTSCSLTRAMSRLSHFREPDIRWVLSLHTLASFKSNVEGPRRR